MKTLKCIFLCVLIAFVCVNCEDDTEDGAEPAGLTGSDSEAYSSKTGDAHSEGAEGSSEPGGGADIGVFDPSDGEQSQAGVITAGEWNDLENWDFWLDLMQEKEWSDFQEYWSFHPVEKYDLHLTQAGNFPLADSEVRLMNADNQPVWTTRTDNFGKAVLWNGLFEQQEDVGYIEVLVNNKSFRIEDLATQEGMIEFNVDEAFEIPGNVEIMFVIDATGSMGDELEYLKTELEDVMNRVKNDQANTQLRLGSIFYRDKGDEYVVRPFALTESTSQIISELKKQRADGGGDYPEAVREALEAAIIQQSWKQDALCRILFLLLDAPPHYEEDVVEDLQRSIKKAAEKGIKIIPVTASGIDKNTEFLMRFFSIATNGTYTFITDHSGVGGDHLEPTTGEYEVEFLNELIIRLIKKYSTINPES